MGITATRPTVQMVLCKTCVALLIRRSGVVPRGTDTYSVDGCDRCSDGRAGHQVYALTH